MSTPKIISHLWIIILLIVYATSCKSDPKKSTENDAGADRSVLVITELMDFQTQDTLNSGWNTFKYVNKSEEPHFILLDKYPEGKHIADMRAEVLPPFDEGMRLIMNNDFERAMEAFGKLPPWFSEIIFSGGTGLISPNNTAITSVYLEPGHYIMECYVKMKNGVFHSSMGMAKEFIVLDSTNQMTSPTPTVNINLSGEGGIVILDDIKKGHQIFKVNYLDQKVHENFVGHDINLVRLGKSADLDAIEAWMNWATPTGLMTPIPDDVIFLGGTNDAPEGSTQYFEVDLEPGSYAFISEVPNSREKGLFQIFTVSE
jgi:hypothetical protein